MTPPPDTDAGILDGELHLPSRRIIAGTGRRACADPDEDAVTLGASAALALLERHPDARPAALVLATVTPPYAEGGSVQPLAEILGVQDRVFAVELTSTPRDGLAGLRIGGSLAASSGPVLVVAAHRGSGGNAEAGDGAVALLVSGAGGVAGLSAGPARAEEARERWRLPGDASTREGDASAVSGRMEEGVRAVLERNAGGAGIVALAGLRVAGRVERALGGPGDAVAARAGALGAAHPLARVLVGLDRDQTVIATANGLVEAVGTRPMDGAIEVASRARAVLDAGVEADAPARAWAPPEGFAPYQSLPRAWRERGAEFRLEAARCPGCGRVLYPPPAGACPSCAHPGPRAVEHLGRTGRVITETRDHVYSGGAVTGMAVVEMDGGGRFYGQVTPSETVAVGDRVRLVPRVLHCGGGVVQYFWKVSRCP